MKKQKIKKHSKLKIFIPSIAIATIISSGTILATNDFNYILNKDYDRVYNTNNIDLYEEEVSNLLNEDVTDKNSRILYATITNPNLSDDDKNIIYDLSDLISDRKFLDEKNAFNSLYNLKINYNISKPPQYADTTKGVYNELRNEIDIYTSRNNITNELLAHEIAHSIFVNKKTKNLPDYFTEGFTELLVNEYYSKSPFLENTTYPFEVNTTKILIEMVGEDKVDEAFTKGDMNIIRNELDRRYPNNSSKAFLESLNNIHNDYNNGYVIDVNNYNNVITYMDNYFSNNENENYNYYRGILSKITSDDPYVQYINYIKENGVLYKAYYSNKLKEEYPVSSKENYTSLVEFMSLNPVEF